MIIQDDIIYFIMTDRFFDGDPNNNLNIDKTNPQLRHGGDLKGIQKQEIPLFKKPRYHHHLDHTPVYLNISDYQGSQAYHGYWPKDFEVMDDHLYTTAEPSCCRR